ncbi:MAG: hypothetical protein MI923_27060 [Phycisphaerales bacterium]|nr:hypothetical protein [Phycisphaerales bacterium]
MASNRESACRYAVKSRRWKLVWKRQVCPDRRSWFPSQGTTAFRSVGTDWRFDGCPFRPAIRSSVQIGANVSNKPHRYEAITDRIGEKRCFGVGANDLFRSQKSVQSSIEDQNPPANSLMLQRRAFVTGTKMIYYLNISCLKHRGPDA